MKIRDALNKGVELLGRKDSSRLDCEVLLAHLLEESREYLFSHPEDEFDIDISNGFLDLVQSRREGVPIAYLINSKDFYGMSFYVDDRVLIPRPETEMLVDLALELSSENGRVLDIGTGSGAIAVSIMHNLPEANAVAVDISFDALEVARKNADVHCVLNRIDFVQSDLLKNVSGSFNVVCANLPYIREDDYVDENVLKYEPSLALFGGLELYKRLFQQLNIGAVDFRYLIGEFGFGQEEIVSSLLSNFFDHKWEIRKDLVEISRVFIVSV